MLRLTICFCDEAFESRGAAPRFKFRGLSVS